MTRLYRAIGVRCSGTVVGGVMPGYQAVLMLCGAMSVGVGLLSAALAVDPQVKAANQVSSNTS